MTSSPTEGDEPAVGAPTLEHIAAIHVIVGDPVTIGRTSDGVRRAVPIRGGEVRGAGLSGRVLDVGADFQRYPADDLAHLVADYVLELDDGHRVLVENRALRSAAPEDLQDLMSGVEVPPERIYFRCVPRLTADESGPHAWMNRTLFLGSGRRRPDGVDLDVFRVR